MRCGTWPHTTLNASGLAVGLPEGQMGNSEVGHLNIGAGRVVYQELTRIDLAIEDGSLFENAVLDEAIDAAVSAGRTVHFMGLLSDGGVHSHIEHLYALLRDGEGPRCREDRGALLPRRPGRAARRAASASCGPSSRFLAELGVGAIGTVMGRYYAMDRDNRWDRVEKAWQAIVLGEGVVGDSAAEAVERSYAEKVTDEFVVPAIVGPAGVREGDSVIFFNFRPDRAREITRAFVDPDLRGLRPSGVPQGALRVSHRVRPHDPRASRVPEGPADPRSRRRARRERPQATARRRDGEVRARDVLPQRRGGEAEARGGAGARAEPEGRDLRPEAGHERAQVTDVLVEAIGEDRADVYLVNYANGDMVGHTGVLDAAVAAWRRWTRAWARSWRRSGREGGVAIITADHGNAECMLDADGKTPFTAHTLSQVPMIVVADGVSGLADGGILADVAPDPARIARHREARGVDGAQPAGILMHRCADPASEDRVQGVSVIALFYVVIVLFVLASLALIVLILLHSGKGTGVSEMFGGMLPSTSTGTGHHREEPRPDHDHHCGRLDRLSGHHDGRVSKAVKLVALQGG